MARDCPIYTTQGGNVTMNWCRTGVNGDNFPAQDIGWRPRADGSRERVTYQNGQWITDEQLAARRSS